jgi:hypothetical protein
MDTDVKFWVQIIGDHMRFISDTLSHEEHELHQYVAEYKATADDYYNNGCTVDQALELCAKVTDLKKIILSRHLNHEIKIMLPPTFINHMLNEMEAMTDILTNGAQPMLVSNKLWLLDAEGHAKSIMSNLDPIEKELKKVLKKLAKKLLNLYILNEEMIGYSRAADSYPREKVAISRIDDVISELANLFLDVRDMKKNNEVLGTFTVLVPDHMYREECYYLRSLGFKTPDPAKPRVE